MMKSILIKLEESTWEKFKELAKKRGVLLQTAVTETFNNAIGQAQTAKPSAKR